MTLVWIVYSVILTNCHIIINIVLFHWDLKNLILQFYFNATKGFHCYQTRAHNPAAAAATARKEHCLDKSKGRKHPAVPDKLVSRLRNRDDILLGRLVLGRVNI